MMKLAKLLLLLCIAGCSVVVTGDGGKVLTSETFATIKIDHADKAAVLRTLGPPAERSRVMMHNYEVWSYRYLEAGVWHSMMHVHFDETGIVRLMQNGPDPMFEEKRHFFR